MRAIKRIRGVARYKRLLNVSWRLFARRSTSSKEMSPLAAFVLSLALFVDATLASPASAGSLTFKRHLNVNRSGVVGSAAVHADRARIAELTKKARKRSTSHHIPGTSYLSAVPVTNAGVAYTAQVGVGSPPTFYSEYRSSRGVLFMTGIHD